MESQGGGKMGKDGRRKGKRRSEERRRESTRREVHGKRGGGFNDILWLSRQPALLHRLIQSQLSSLSLNYHSSRDFPPTLSLSLSLLSLSALHFSINKSLALFFFSFLVSAFLLLCLPLSLFCTLSVLHTKSRGRTLFSSASNGSSGREKEKKREPQKLSSIK